MRDKPTYIFYAPELILIVAAFAFVAYKTKSIIIGLFAVALLGFLLFFFRPAGIPSGFQPPANTIVSPAQGQVLTVEGNKISIYLSPLDVHVQYAPIDAKVIGQLYKPGEFNAANFFEKSNYNERLETSLMTSQGPMKIVQISGQLARRIVSFLEPNQQLRAGEPLGLIKLGSRVDVYLPSTCQPTLKQGDRVFVGDAIGRF
jgi:phosphatidylserine decarboxylase